MPDVLVYETSDPDFANRAIEALNQADIPSFKTGTGYRDLRPGLRQDLGNTICLYIRRQVDYARANAILIRLGAYVERPPELRVRKSMLVLVGALIAVVLFVALNAGFH
jgi:hypothetical protein